MTGTRKNRLQLRSEGMSRRRLLTKTDIAPFQRALAQEYATELGRRYEIYLKRGEHQSPIECLFRIALEYCNDPYLWNTELRWQVVFGTHRVDFLLYAKDHKKAAVIECDGRAFHHLTWEQIEADRQRDHYLEGLGLKVFRFPGSQIVNDPSSCVGAILSWLEECEIAAYREGSNAA